MSKRSYKAIFLTHSDKSILAFTRKKGTEWLFLNYPERKHLHKYVKKQGVLSYPQKSLVPLSLSK